MMKNSLGQYIAKYCEGITFTPEEHITCEISGVEAAIDTFVYDGGNCGAEKAHLTLRKNGAVYECDCIDGHNWQKLLFPITLGGQEYLIFRKTLYGFTLIHTDTLREEYDYFPAEVLEKEEAYIFTDAVSFDDLIIFDGCFWACPYFYAVYDHEVKRCIFLFNEFRVESDDIPPAIENGTVTLSCVASDRNKIKLSFTSDDLRKLIREKGTEIL